MKPILLLVVLLAAMTAAISGQCVEQVYAWTDAGGVKHFSDSPPPPGVKNVRRLTLQGGTTASSNPPANEAAETPAADSNPAPAANQPVGNDTASRAKACETARNNLKLLQSDYPISMPGADGKPQKIDKQRRNLEVARAKDQAAFYCK